MPPLHRLSLLTPLPDGQYILGNHSVEAVAQQEDRGLLLARVVAGNTIFEQHDIVIVEECVACRLFDAPFCCDAGHNDRLNAITSQEQIEIGTPKTT